MRRIAFAAALTIAAGPVNAAQQDGPVDELSTREPEIGDDIVVYGRAIEQIGKATSASQGTVGYADLEMKPIGRVGELVENVPGLIATQHSGTGKANQYYLRGFNLDHGTDLAGYVDGVPVNLRTHAHGQGYLDLNFLIPELVKRIDYAKGPYATGAADFSAAGTVRFTTVDTLPAPLIQATVGSYGYRRMVVAGSGRLGTGDLLLGLDGTMSDGPWVLNERLRKVNAVARYSVGTASHGWTIGLTGYRASWIATDQVPLRAIENGRIDRYGFIDPDLGGATTRIGFTGHLRSGETQADLYALRYRFRLISNFTYLLDDPVNGDQFKQRDRRAIIGGSMTHDVPMTIEGLPLTLTVGADARWDHIGDVGLFRTRDATTIGTVRRDRIGEYSGGLYVEGKAALTDRLRLVLGLRGDAYGFDVDARTLAANSGRGVDAMLSPKGALAWKATERLELYADYGESFHSNDVRGVTIRVDPSTGEAADRVPALVKARGAEVGARLELGRMTASLVGYHLTLGSELVYSGDAGTTEPNAASRRYGAEATVFWRPSDRIAVDAAYSTTRARLRGVAKGADRIPNSIGVVAAGGLEARLGEEVGVSLRVRHFGTAPLTEDDSARSDPTTLLNLGLTWRRKQTRLSVDLLNVAGSRDNDITYFYASRLVGEPSEGVDDIHLHPVEPRQVRVTLSRSF